MTRQPYHTVRNSKIHGRGVFAKRPIRKGTKIIEYTGKIISADEADEMGTTTDDGHTHTMLFSIDKDRVILGNVGGAAKYINHSCAPNCEAVQYGDKIFIESLRSIPQGEELTYDYHLEVPGKITEKVKKQYACFCGSTGCRGTQIAASILDKQAKKDEKKKKDKEKKDAAKALKKTKKAEEKAKKKETKKAKKKKKKDSTSGDSVKSSGKKKKSKTKK